MKLSPRGPRATGQVASRLLLVVYSFYTLSTSSASGASNANSIAQFHTAINLNETNFNSTLKALPSGSFALIEFYASWCPHCQHYAPEYEKIAVFFKKHTKDGINVFVGRVDCAAEVGDDSHT